MKVIPNDDRLCCVADHCPDPEHVPAIIWVPEPYERLGDEDPDPEQDTWNGAAYHKECRP